MKYSFTGRVRFSEVDENGVLTIPGLINYFQDCSFFSSEYLGVGIDYLKEKKRAWFLASWQILVRELPTFGQELKVSTWACGFNHFTGTRNFTLEGEDGTLFASAVSLWAYVNTETGFPAIPDQEETDRYGYEEPLKEDFGSRKIRLPKTGRPKDAFAVHRCHLDTNHHVNNGQYIAMAEDYRNTEKQIAGIRVEYKTAAVLGDIIYPVAYETDKGTAVSLNQENGKPYAVVEFVEK